MKTFGSKHLAKSQMAKVSSKNAAENFKDKESSKQLPHMNSKVVSETIKLPIIEDEKSNTPHARNRSRNNKTISSSASLNSNSSEPEIASNKRLTKFGTETIKDSINENSITTKQKVSYFIFFLSVHHYSRRTQKHSKITTLKQVMILN